MKNIHILATSKPSRLVKFFTNKFHLCKEILPIQDEEQYQNIYITSDEEIKEEDWYFNNTGSAIEKLRYRLPSGGAFCKKIILTTDQDLIKDGVQPIPDEFLEWFVKNPTCEKVKVVKEKQHIGEEVDESYPKGFFDYKIIIPKEERKIDSCRNFDREIGCIQVDCKCEKEESKREITLEEDAKQAFKTKDFCGLDINPFALGYFIEGAKWHQEQIGKSEFLQKLRGTKSDAEVRR